MFYGVELFPRACCSARRAILAGRARTGDQGPGGDRHRVAASKAKPAAPESFWSFVQSLGLRVLPNTAGCHSVQEAVTTAHMARELFDTPWIKLEVIGDADTLQPDVFGLVEAARILAQDGFEVFPTRPGPDRRRSAGRGRAAAS